MGAWLLNSSAEIISWDAIATLNPSTFSFNFGKFVNSSIVDLGVTNNSTGQLGYWALSSGAISGSFQPVFTIPSGGWAPDASGDYTDNGLDDILLGTDHNNEPGQLGFFSFTVSGGNTVSTWNNVGSLT